MNRFTIFCFVLLGCSSGPPKGDPITDLRDRRDAGGGETTAKVGDITTDTDDTQPTSSSPTTTTTGETTVPDAGAAPAPQAICDLGNGLYCGGNHAPGAANELYRCTDGVPSLVETCAGDCARYPDGQNDHCSCWLGNGLYCGGNGVNGDTSTLYRCANGVVTVEQTCSNGCETKPNGFNDVCF
jgi:hypothetical protein